MNRVTSKTIDRYQQIVNKVTVYIQENLDSPLPLEELSKVACISQYHFHRIFRAYTGEGIKQYIKRIRLENAAFKLLHSKVKVSDIAHSVGYNSIATFSNAFKRHYSVSPKEYKNRRYDLYYSIQNNHGDTNAYATSAIEPDYFQDVDKEQLLYIRAIGRYQDVVAEAWSSLMKYAFHNRLITESTRLIGITYDSPIVTEDERLRYEACITVQGNVNPKGKIGQKYLIPGKYAVFCHHGSYDSSWMTYNSIYIDWVVNKGNELRDAPSFAEYPSHGTPSAGDIIRIYIPI